MKVVGDNRMCMFGGYVPAFGRTVKEATPEQVSDIWRSEDTKALCRTTLKLVNGSLKGFRIFMERAIVATAGSQWTWERIYSITLRKVGHTAL
jgi:hypothetical protein